MAGIIGIYGLVVSVLISNDLKQESSLFTGFIQLGAGLAVGLAGMAAGFAIGIVGDAGVRGTAQQPRLFVGMILILIFAEVLGMNTSERAHVQVVNTNARSLWSHRRPSHEFPRQRLQVLDSFSRPTMAAHGKLHLQSTDLASESVGHVSSRTTPLDTLCSHGVCGMLAMLYV